MSIVTKAPILHWVWRSSSDKLLYKLLYKQSNLNLYAYIKNKVILTLQQPVIRTNFFTYIDKFNLGLKNSLVWLWFFFFFLWHIWLHSTSALQQNCKYWWICLRQKVTVSQITCCLQHLIISALENERWNRTIFGETRKTWNSLPLK